MGYEDQDMVKNSGGGGGLQADRRQAEDDRHRYHSGSNVGNIEASFSRKAPDKVLPPPTRQCLLLADSQYFSSCKLLLETLGTHGRC